MYSINFNLVNEVLEEYLHNTVIQLSLQKHGDESTVYRIKAAHMIPIVVLSYKWVTSNFISTWNDVNYSVVEGLPGLLALKG